MLTNKLLICTRPSADLHNSVPGPQIIALINLCDSILRRYCYDFGFGMTNHCGQRSIDRQVSDLAIQTDASKYKWILCCQLNQSRRFLFVETECRA